MDRLVERAARGVTRVDGLRVLRQDVPSPIEGTLYEPVLCVVLRGRKQVTAGGRTLSFGPGECLLVSHDLPVLSEVTTAPYLALVFAVDIATVRELDGTVTDSGPARAAQTHRADPGLLDALYRYLALADSPADARVLGPLTARELARRVGMSASSFHKHFKTVTATTPLQYQKELRLLAARRLLTAGGASVTAAAFDVGYESPSQFSREYARKFGRPPSRDPAPAARVNE